MTLTHSRTSIVDLEEGITAALDQLSVLVGKPPGALNEYFAESRPLPDVSIDFAIGVPADIIRQRPDIRKAERELAAQAERIGVAKAELYPQFTLSGSIGLEAISFGKLISDNTRSWMFGPTISWPIFNAGSIRNNIKIQIELKDQALIRYEASILSALSEVENVLLSYAKEQEKQTLLASAADDARDAYELASDQYATGMTDFNELLEAQRSLLSIEDQLVQSKGSVLSDLIRLYKALGGGWQTFEQCEDNMTEKEE